MQKENHPGCQTYSVWFVIPVVLRGLQVCVIRCRGDSGWLWLLSALGVARCSAVAGLQAGRSFSPLSAPIPHRCQASSSALAHPRLKWQADLLRTSPLFLQNKSRHPPHPHIPSLPL